MRRFLAAGITTLALLVAGSTPAAATHGWSNYHWARAASPFTLTLGDNMTADWDSYLVKTSSDWSLSTVLDTAITGGTTNGRKCRANAGTVQVCNAAYGKNGWLGLAQIWVSSSHITQGTAKMNDSYFVLSQYNNSSEKLHVVCQEVAHTFGLGHQDESGASLNTCMDYYHNVDNNDTKSTTPNAHDYAQLELIYNSHLDSAAGASAGSVAAFGVAGASEDGTPFGASRARGSWYVHDLGNGRLLFTHVFWAPLGR